MKIVTIEMAEQRIEQKFPNQPYEILEYTRVSKPFIIKCLKCNKISKYSSFSNFINSGRKSVCHCYNNNDKRTVHENNKNKILSILENNPNKEFKCFGYKKETKKHTVIIYCKNCKQYFTKTWTDFLKNDKCPLCENRHNLNDMGFKATIPEEYEVLSSYVNESTKILVKHKSCGFIWKTIPRNLYHQIGCPRCNKKRSRGERAISNFLTQWQIDFVPEKSFEWQSNPKRRYDFYLPDYNLVIEYMGEQHYQETTYFPISLAEQQEIDNIKKQETLDNNLNYLEICYKNFKNIEAILTNWFNDYSERK